MDMEITMPTFDGRPRRRPRVAPRGFTFAEVMFAVVILGIGFIMIAAVFPVAIKMNGESIDGTQGALVAQQAIASISAKATDSLFPLTYRYNSKSYSLAGHDVIANTCPPFLAIGEAVSVGGTSPDTGPWSRDEGNTGTVPQPAATTLAANQWAALQADLVSSPDKRFGVAVAYARSGPPTNVSTGVTGSSSLNLVVVTARVRGEHQAFNDQDDTGASNNRYWAKDARIPPYDLHQNTTATPNLYLGAKWLSASSQDGSGVPTPATLQFKRQIATFSVGFNGTAGSPGSPDTVTFKKNASVPTPVVTGDVSAAVEGMFLIVSRPNAGVPTLQYKPMAKFNGTVFKVGRQIAVDAAGSVTFELASGSDVSSLQLSATDLNALCVNGRTANPTNTYEVLFLGRALQDPTQPYSASNPYVGPAMDVSVYSTTIGLNK